MDQGEDRSHTGRNGTGVASLRYASDEEPGIRRLGRRRFRYVDHRGHAVSADDLARIRAIAVPPAWTDVWIAPDPDAHVQATGRDSRHRKQYRYHPSFRASREATKFDDLVPFAAGLGRLRSQVDSDLRRAGLPHDRVVAAVVHLLDTTFLRVGNEEYARANRSFGLTTLRTRHASATARSVELHFVGKGGHRFDVRVDSRRLAGVVRRCQELPGQQLFRYVDDGEVRNLCSSDVNDYVREHTGCDATAKTFRTWGASVLAAASLAGLDLPESERAAASVVNDVVREVADRLGNTPAVCRRSYVHPTIVDAFLGGRLDDEWHRPIGRSPAGLAAAERRLLRLLRAA